jgi:ferrous iron transport protein B
MSDKDNVVIALAGQPNVGKSTVFNDLTGLDQHVGNWPGKTVEQKKGHFKLPDGTDVEIVDLPGTYSLTANSPEEEIARDFVIRENPDLVVTVVNAAALERGLYLVGEILHLTNRVVLALNMMDVAQDEKINVEPEVLQAALRIPVVPMVARRGEGKDALVRTIQETLKNPPSRPCKPSMPPEIEKLLDQVEPYVKKHLPEFPSRWAALKLLEGDPVLLHKLESVALPDEWKEMNELLISHEDLALKIAGARYEWVGRMVRAALVRPKHGQMSITRQIDKYATHPVLGLVILLAVMGLIFWVTYTLGAPLQDLLNHYIVEIPSNWITGHSAGLPQWLVSLIVDGVIGGAGLVITFAPILFIFFFSMGLLEDVGYMARGAFAMDRFMHHMGLHGKSFMPLFLGFGCNVPAVMGTRIIESRRARLLTLLLVPLVPCSARMVVLSFMTAVFFSNIAPFVTWGLVILNLLVLGISGVLINKLVFKGERTAFIMELPLYHTPDWKALTIRAWQRLWLFIKNAGTLIVSAAILIWFLSYFPGGGIENSYLAVIGRFLAPIGRLMGLDWKMLVALLASFVAKENSIATMGVLLGGSGENLAKLLPHIIPPAGALAFLVTQMLFIPCVATVAAMYQELENKLWLLFDILFLTAVAFGAGIAVYQIALLLGIGV